MRNEPTLAILKLVEQPPYALLMLLALCVQVALRGFRPFSLELSDNESPKLFHWFVLIHQ